MKKFKFDLEKLLSYKNQILKSEMQKLANITAQILATEKEIARLKSEQSNTGRELADKMEKAISPLECQMYQNYIDKLRDNIKIQKKQLEHLRMELEKQREVVAEAKKESRSLEILKENKYSDYVKEVRKTEEREIEEFISAQNAIDNQSLG